MAGLRVDASARLVEFVARQLTADLADAALDGLRPADLYLACACAQGLPGAIDAFDRDYMREVDIALARMRIGPPRLNDVKQLVRQRLFVGGGTAGAPTSAGKISEYGGRGDLRRWVRSVAVRTCLNELRKGKREVLVDDDHLIAQHAITADDPEVEYMKRTYSNEFKAAFAEALGAARRRASRRCCATTTSTASTSTRSARSIASIASPRSAGSRRRRSSSSSRRSSTLRARLKLPAAELDSVLRMIRSQIHLSLVRHLGGPKDNVADDAIELDPSEIEEV